MRSQACRGKNHWRTVEMAMRAKAKAERKHGWKMRFYLCDECGEYHLARSIVRGQYVLLAEHLRNTDAGE